MRTKDAQQLQSSACKNILNTLCIIVIFSLSGIYSELGVKILQFPALLPPSSHPSQPMSWVQNIYQSCHPLPSPLIAHCEAFPDRAKHFKSPHISANLYFTPPLYTSQLPGFLPASSSHKVTPPPTSSRLFSGTATFYLLFLGGSSEVNRAGMYLPSSYNLV